MARKPRTLPHTPAAQKMRTREHVIASQSVAHIERFIAAAGHTAERFVSDYGYDLSLYTYAPNGGVEPGNVLIQIKATEGIRTLRDSKAISFPVEWRDIALWRSEIMPVIFIVHDIVQDVAYWLYVQEWLEDSATRFQPLKRSGNVNAHFSINNVVNEQAIGRFREFKRIVFDQIQGKVDHHG